MSGGYNILGDGIFAYLFLAVCGIISLSAILGTGYLVLLLLKYLLSII